MILNAFLAIIVAAAFSFLVHLMGAPTWGVAATFFIAYVVKNSYFNLMDRIRKAEDK